MKEVWRILRLDELINNMCTFEREESSVLGDLFLTPGTAALLLSDVNMNDLIATAVWYVWWERCQLTHGEQLLEPARSAQAISKLAKKISRAKKKGVGRIQCHGWVKPSEGCAK